MSERVERLVLVLIVVVVGALAGRASFSHVVQWSMANMPPGTDVSYGYTNAAVSELLPVGVLLFVRYRRRQGGMPGLLAWSMLIAAGLFSLTAQLAVAVPSVSGWLVASVPTLAFMGLTKLLLSMKPLEVVTPAKVAPWPVPLAPPIPAVVQEEGVPARLKPARSAPRTTGAMPAERAALTGSTGAATKRITAKSLTNAAKVAAAVTELGAAAKPAQIAARAGVSESTARRHMPRKVASPSVEPPAGTSVTDVGRPELVMAGAA